jgi:hypothetical protein
MSENVKLDNVKCVKANTTYYKIKIDDIIEYEIDKFGVDESLYKKFNGNISENFKEFTDDIISGKDFDEAKLILRDKAIAEYEEINKKSSSNNKSYFRISIFDQIYTMLINIKKGMLPDDYEQKLEEERAKLEEDEEAQRAEEEKEQIENDREAAENDIEEKQPDIVDLMWNYFFNNAKPITKKTEEKKNEKVMDEKDKSKNKSKSE